MAVNAIDRIRMARYSAFQWRCELSLVKKLGLAVAMACVTGLIAQVRIALPWTPVPITGQTFAALLAGVLLGQWWGGISMAIYAGLGIAGIPWFIGWTGGVAHLAGPTGGYIIGFIFAALFVGHCTDKYVKARKFPRMLGLILFANLVLIYVPGLLQLYLWSNLINGSTTGIYQVLTMGFFPFIIGDVIKSVAVAVTAWAVTPKQAYNRESDRE
ncbi:MAG: biotin transporter BioY [Dehalococcoidales bacterium]|nr:biotin transporter BioY [Dehalococcoidales bacterium]